MHDELLRQVQWLRALVPQIAIHPDVNLMYILELGDLSTEEADLIGSRKSILAEIVFPLSII